MKLEKYAFLTPICLALLKSPILWLRIIIITFCFLDISLGVYTAIRKGDGFSFCRLMQGFIKCFFYLIIVWFMYIVNIHIFTINFGGIDLLIPKLFTLIVIVLEAESMDKKRVRLGKQPFLVSLRNWIKVVKEICTSIKKITQ